LMIEGENLSPTAKYSKDLSPYQEGGYGSPAYVAADSTDVSVRDQQPSSD
jgi:hypothetical protein